MLLRAVVIGRQLLYVLDHAYLNHGFEDSQPSRIRAIASGIKKVTFHEVTSWSRLSSTTTWPSSSWHRHASILGWGCLLHGWWCHFPWTSVLCSACWCWGGGSPSSSPGSTPGSSCRLRHYGALLLLAPLLPLLFAAAFYLYIWNK